MSYNTTDLELMRFAYGEMSAEETIRMQEAIGSHPELKSRLEEIYEVQKWLNQGFTSPHPTSISIINEFSHDSHTETV